MMLIVVLLSICVLKKVKCLLETKFALWQIINNEVVGTRLKNPKEVKKDSLEAGEVGYLTAAINLLAMLMSETLLPVLKNLPFEPLAGYRKLRSMVYCGLYPTDNSRYNDLRDALEKLKLNDSSILVESSKALGFGFRLGFRFITIWMLFKKD